MNKTYPKLGEKMAINWKVCIFSLVLLPVVRKNDFICIVLIEIHVIQAKREGSAAATDSGFFWVVS